MLKFMKRAMISFDGQCPLKCKYCYTYDLKCADKNRTVKELVDSLDNEEFDIIYVSQTYENFANQLDGVDLCRSLYKKYNKDIFIITKSELDNRTISHLVKLNNIMRESGKQLFFGVSLCSDESYSNVENKYLCPSPEIRLSNLKKMHLNGINTLLILRPIFPNFIIPIDECLGLIKKSIPYVDAVVSSGLIITDSITNRLNIKKQSLLFLEEGDTDYLANIDRERIDFVDVSEELKVIEEQCIKLNIPFFSHTMPALNYVINH